MRQQEPIVICTNEDFVVARATCLTESDRGPRNSSWQWARSTPVVGFSLERHTAQGVSDHCDVIRINEFFLTHQLKRRINVDNSSFRDRRNWLLKHHPTPHAFTGLDSRVYVCPTIALESAANK
ncbi:hypothetical protein TNCV_4806581 [Trichonephila clavipes]|nr:hypothetical protein TNCV_4806581 [Trichonephila clavipes]